MSNQVTIQFLRRRFANLVCPAMGWNCTDQVWMEGVAVVGATFIQQAPNKKYWRIVQITSKSGGENNLSDNFTKSELLAWMDGVLKVADMFAAKGIFLNKQAAEIAKARLGE